MWDGTLRYHRNTSCLIQNIFATTTFDVLLHRVANKYPGQSFYSSRVMCIVISAGRNLLEQLTCMVDLVVHACMPRQREVGYTKTRRQILISYDSYNSYRTKLSPSKQMG